MITKITSENHYISSRQLSKCIGTNEASLINTEIHKAKTFIQ